MLILKEQTNLKFINEILPAGVTEHQQNATVSEKEAC